MTTTQENVAVNSKINYYNTDNIGVTEDMNYTNIEWNGKSYKIGLRLEAESKWEGKQELEDIDGIKKYSDVCKANVNAYVYAPKDYDGVMIAMQKSGTSIEAIEKEIEAYNKYVSENNQANEQQVGNYKLLESKYDTNSKLSNDEFYVFRLTDLEKANQ